MLYPGWLLPFCGFMLSAVVIAQSPPPTLPAPPPPAPIVQPAPPPPATQGLPFLLQGREANMRGALAKRYGMKPASDVAVVRALQWLKDQQNADGSWGTQNRGAMTGLALLAFLGRGEGPASVEFGKSVSKALEWVLSQGTLNGARLHMWDSFSRNSDVYEHGILTYAVAEYYAMTRDERFEDLLKMAVKFILRGQGPGGGWNYNYDQTRNDLSVSGWQIQALRLAHLGGIEHLQSAAALTKTNVYLDRMRGPNGGYGYTGPEDRYSLTGTGVFCRLLWKGGRNDVRNGVSFILKVTEKDKPVRYRSEWADLYAWYYHTYALFVVGGEAWKRWRDWFQDDLVAAQSADGSWAPPGGRAYGPQGADTVDGGVYRTSLCALMLEVAYRYQWPPLGF